MQLKCIRCGALALRDVGTARECPACGASFPLRGDVLYFIEEEFYSDSFGFQWNRFARTQLDSANGSSRSHRTFMEKTGWALDSLKGKRVLDAGCGMGRFAEVCADAGAEVHAVDLSSAVEAASQNLGRRPNVRIYQADIMNLPFPEESFDFIYSIGVLHHTPNTKAAFLRLPHLLKPGGSLAIWVYSAELRGRYPGGEVLRRVTPSLSKRWLLWVSWIAIPLYYIHRIPVLGVATSMCLPTSMDPDPRWRWLDTFDWYSPKYQWKHTYAEVEQWCREAGLTEIKGGQFPVTVGGTRPRSSC